MTESVIKYCFLILAFWTGSVPAQDCTTAQANGLCADGPAAEDSLRTNPVSFGCFNLSLTHFYSFTTGSNEGAGVQITVTPDDCDNFSGNDPITVLVVQLAAGADPCDQSSYTAVSSCLSSDEEETYSLSGLDPESDFLVLVGSSHSPVYGPCTYSLSISGSAVDLVAAVDPFLIVLGETTTLSASGASSGSSYNWTPANQVDSNTSSTTTAVPESSMTYMVTSSIGDCTVNAVVSVAVGPPIVIFNTFTPNADGFNDTWKINGIERFEDALVTVYDRWGQSIFRSLGYGSPWDGTNRGRFLPAGSYYYVIELNSPNVNIPPISGVVSIIR
jgi:gliding motility-associated-like protein